MAGYFVYIYPPSRSVPELRFLDVEPSELSLAMSGLLKEWDRFDRLEIYPEDADLRQAGDSLLGARHGVASPNHRPRAMSAHDPRRHTA